MVMVHSRAGDCDDERADVHPARSETPYNGRDDDCNPATSDDDVDGDGFRAQSVGGSTVMMQTQRSILV